MFANYKILIRQIEKELVSIEEHIISVYLLNNKFFYFIAHRNIEKCSFKRCREITVLLNLT